MIGPQKQAVTKARSYLINCMAMAPCSELRTGLSIPFAESMTTIQNATVEQVRKLVSIKERIETLQGEIEAIIGNGGSAAPANAEPQNRVKISRSEAARVAITARWGKMKLRADGLKAPKKRRKMSAAARVAIATAQQARWAKIKSNGATHSEQNGKSRLSAAGKAAIIAGTKARWAKIRASKGEAASKKKGKSVPLTS
jgi:hypothetical protein